MNAPEERVRLDRSEPSSADISRTELLDLYRIVIDEYRFQVRLNWDRTQYSFVLNTALTTLGFTVMATLKQGGSWIALWIFAIAAVAAWLGRTVVKTGHSYYRRIVYRKTMIEDLLGRLTPLPAYRWRPVYTTPSNADTLKTKNAAGPTGRRVCLAIGKLAPAVGLEPTTRGLTVRCSTN
jgi:hypothetical protein